MEQAMKTQPTPYRSSYWVHPSVLCGFFPAEPTEYLSFAKLRSLLDYGITVTVDLTEPEELSTTGVPLFPYWETWRDVGKQSGVAVETIGFPIKDNRVPKIKKLQKVLGQIAAHVQNGRKVYIHCRGGIGRTGVVACSWLLWTGYCDHWSVFKAFDALRKGSALEGHYSPEAGLQREFVLGAHEAIGLHGIPKLFYKKTIRQKI
jgi:atypical dual specificity phosphatase